MMNLLAHRLLLLSKSLFENSRAGSLKLLRISRQRNIGVRLYQLFLCIIKLSESKKKAMEQLCPNFSLDEGELLYILAHFI